MKVLRNGSKELIKEINRFKVLNVIRHQYPISRSEIARQCDLGVSTLSYIIDDLKNQDLIYEVGESTSTGGRRAKLLQFNKNYGSMVSVKIEEGKFLIALTNMDAEIMHKRSILFEKKLSAEKVVNKIADEIIDIFQQSGMNFSKLLGIGVLSSGLVNRHEGVIIRSTLLGWKNVPITEMLNEKIKNVKIFVDNNINGYTFAELEKGIGKDTNSFLVVSVGAGLGLSVVINREIFYGAIGGAGEFGHTTIAIDGYRCHCGQKGCLEMYASEFYFENKGKKMLSKYPDTKLRNFTFDEVARCAEEKDELASLLISEMAEYLGYGIRNLINTFNPEKIVIAGEGTKYSHLFMDPLNRIAKDNFFSNVDIKTDIVISSLKDEAWLVGGALLAIDHIYQEPIYETVNIDER